MDVFNPQLSFPGMFMTTVTLLSKQKQELSKMSRSVSGVYCNFTYLISCCKVALK